MGLRAVVIATQPSGRNRNGRFRQEAFAAVSRAAETERAPRVLRVIATAPAALSVAEGIPLLMRLAANPDRKIAHAALRGLGSLGRRYPGELDEVAPFLVKRLRAELRTMEPGASATASVVIGALGELDDRRALPPIRKAYEDHQKELARACLRAARPISRRKPERNTAGGPRPLTPADPRTAKYLRRAAQLHVDLTAWAATADPAYSGPARPLGQGSVGRMFSPEYSLDRLRDSGM